MLTLKEQIYILVKQIPSGFVVTYGDIAAKLGLRDVRLVGWALHQNKSLEVPCHRVVNKDGRLAPNFAFNGAEEQYRRLEAEQVTFVDSMHVDMTKHHYQFDSTR